MHPDPVDLVIRLVCTCPAMIVDSCLVPGTQHQCAAAPQDETGLAHECRKQVSRINAAILLSGKVELG